jgi:phosphoribosylformimino-5-aminoimidazole carboxamide ribotide isomerase
VIDLKAGQVVRGIAGRRDEYRPIISRLTSSADPLLVARALVDRFHPTELYLADLDAIETRSLAWRTYAEIQFLGVPLWLDAGIRDCRDAKELAEAGFAGIVCGLETLRGPDELEEILDRFGRERIVFSLDLKNGRLFGDRKTWSITNENDVQTLFQRVVGFGIQRMIMLDLARVGIGNGPGDIEFYRTLKEAHPAVELIVGGGIQGIDDLELLGKAGVSGALAASALHDGRINPRAF